VYKLEENGSLILKNLVHEEQMGIDCPNFFDLGAGGLNLLASCVTPRVLVYKIGLEKNGALVKLLDFKADFKKEDSSLNVCKFSTDNCLLATGGDDFDARVYQITTGERFGLETIP